MIPCKQCGDMVPDDFESKMEHIYYEHTDRFILAFLDAIRPVNVHQLGAKVAEYFNVDSNTN